MDDDLSPSDEQPTRVGTLRRYHRPVEVAPIATAEPGPEMIAFQAAASALASSSLSEGSRALLLGLLRTGTTRIFPGGGVGIEYGSLLKTAVRPDDLGGHVADVAAHLQAARVDVLLVPGMSGYPVGAMYALASNTPAILLKKQSVGPLSGDEVYPSGSFAIPSYTGESDVVLSADLDAVDDIVAGIVARQIALQETSDSVTIEVRCAGADDIIDKATMAHAITESAPLICESALSSAVARHRAATGDSRRIDCHVSVVAWAAPLIKRYNNPHTHLERTFGITPFAGIEITSVHLDPSAIGVEGAGLFAFRS